MAKRGTSQACSAGKRLKAFSSVGLSQNHRQLARALQTLTELPAVDALEVLGTKRWQLQHAVDQLWSQLGCEIELEAAHGETLTLQCTSLSKLLEYMVRTHPEFRKQLLELWLRNPCTRDHPYSLLIYGDELVPGNVLHLEQRRKLFGAQAAIKDLGSTSIKANSSWIPLFCIRHIIASDIPGGMSYIFRQYLRHLLLKEKIRDVGIVIPLNTGSATHVNLFFKVSNLILDGDALRMIWNWKGASSKLPCFCCLNVVGAIEDDDDLPDGCVTLECTNKSRFIAATNTDWWARADTLKLQQHVLSKTRFAKLSTASGLTFNERGLLWDEELRPYVGPMDVTTMDSMHSFLVDGVGQAEIRCALLRLKELGDSWDGIHRIMCADWKFCRMNIKGLRTLRSSFSAKREARFKDTQMFSPDASELLVMFPIFGYYLDTIAGPRHGPNIVAAIDSFHACACCLALVKEGKSVADDAIATQLDDAIVTHKEKKAIAYPGEHARAKDHWTLHIGDQMKRDKVTLDCFAGERVNRAFKNSAQQVTFDADKKLSFEASVLKRTLVHYDSQWKEHACQDALSLPVRSPELGNVYGTEDAFLANSMMWHGTVVAKKDLVFLDGHPQEVVGCASIAGHLALVVHELTLVSQETLTASKWRYASPAWSLKFLANHELRYASAWFENDNMFIVLSI